MGHRALVTSLRRQSRARAGALYAGQRAPSAKILENKNSKRKDLNCNHPTSNQHIPKIPLTFGTLRSTPKN